MVHTKAVRDLFLGVSGQEADFYGLDVLVRQLPDERHYSEPAAMQVVIGSRGPFEIVNSVVGLDQVNMVDFLQVSWVGDECDCYKAMDRDELCDRVSAKQGYWISTVSNVNSKVSTFNWSETACLALRPAVKASNFSEVADLVEGAKFVNSDWTPLFCNSGVHTALVTQLHCTAQGEIQCR